MLAATEGTVRWPEPRTSRSSSRRSLAPDRSMQECRTTKRRPDLLAAALRAHRAIVAPRRGPDPKGARTCDLALRRMKCRRPRSRGRHGSRGIRSADRCSIIDDSPLAPHQARLMGHLVVGEGPRPGRTRPRAVSPRPVTGERPPPRIRPAPRSAQCRCPRDRSGMPPTAHCS